MTTFQLARRLSEAGAIFGRRSFFFLCCFRMKLTLLFRAALLAILFSIARLHWASTILNRWPDKALRGVISRPLRCFGSGHRARGGLRHQRREFATILI